MALVATLACSGDDNGDQVDAAPLAALTDRSEVTTEELGPFELDREGMAGPGTPLGGGLEVPDGAILLGVPFPDLIGGGYRALLLVPGDPVGVFNALEDQARAQGMDADSNCITLPGEVGCLGTYVDRSDGESLSLSLVRHVAEDGVISGLGMRYLPPGSEETGGGSDAGPVAPTAPIAPLFLPEGPVGPPDPADVVAVLRSPDSPVRTVELGSTLIGLPGPCACVGPGWSFVVQLTGVERDTIAGYARQFSDLGDPPDISDRRRDDVSLLGVRVGTGSPVAEVRAVVPDSGPSYAIVSYMGS